MGDSISSIPPGENQIYPVQYLRCTAQSPSEVQTPDSEAVSSSATPAPSASSKAIAAYLEGLCRDQIQAINDRNFDYTSPVWQNKASFWRAEIGFLSDTSLTLTEWVDSWRTIAEQFPTYHMKCLDMTSTVDEADGSAEIYTSMQAENMPPGITRPGMSVAIFKLVQGKWVATKFKTMNGPEGA